MAQEFSLQYLTAVVGFDYKSFQVMFWWTMWYDVTIFTKYLGLPGSSVSIATDYGLDGPGSNPGGDEISRPSRPVLWPTQPPVKWVLGLSRG